MTSFSGYGVQGSDPNLADKLAKLKSGHQSPTDRLNSFLEKDMGVDPAELPFNPGSARHRMYEILEGESANVIELVGNSMGIKSVLLIDTTAPDATCIECGQSNGYWRSDAEVDGDDAPLSGWFCYECEEPQDIAPVYPEPVEITADDPKGRDWHDLLRIYTAFNHYLPLDEGSAHLRGTYYRFRATKAYRECEITVPGIEPPNPDPSHYPTGTLLRVEKHVLDENGKSTSRREYVRIGGLFNDSDVTILNTMQPIEDLTGWNVVEEL